MTNSIGTSASSMASMASSMFGSAREALKAMAEAATTVDTSTANQAVPGGGKKGRIGTVLDCYA